MDPSFYRTGGSVRPTHRAGGGRQLAVALIVMAVLVTGLWLVLRDWGGGDSAGTPPGEQMLRGETAQGDSPSQPADQPAGQPADQPAGQPAGPANPTPVEIAREGHIPDPAPVQMLPEPQQKQLADRLAEAEAAFAANDPLKARALFNAIVDKGLGAEENDKCVQRLGQLADATIFGMNVIPADKTVESFEVPPNGVLAKIARTHKVNHLLLQWINNIPNPKLLRAGQTIKVVNGPFNGVVDKSEFTLSMYLDVPDGVGRPATPLLVRRYKVGLGEYNSTPTGVWKVRSMDSFPPYRHPRTGQWIAKTDKDYPFGKLGLWVSLEGVFGNALGQQGYGLHSTNDPASIGKQASLGCVRLGDADMNELWKLLRIGDSRVTIRE